MNNSCIFCNLASCKTVIQENGYYGKKCSKCNLIFISPLPTDESIKNLYAEDDQQGLSQLAAYLGKRSIAKHHLKLEKKLSIKDPYLN